MSADTRLAWRCRILLETLAVAVLIFGRLFPAHLGAMSAFGFASVVLALVGGLLLTFDGNGLIGLLVSRSLLGVGALLLLIEGRPAETREKRTNPAARASNLIEAQRRAERSRGTLTHMKLGAISATLFASTALCAISTAQAVSGSWRQTWSDEFNSGASDLSGWSYDLGNGTNGWGNNELENYTDNAANVSVSGGLLHITAQAKNGQYTSGRIKTDKVFSQTNGLFEFRAKLPQGQGLWPAVWMLPKDWAYGGWPTSGEIDLLESRGQDSKLVQGTLHSGPIWWADNVQTQTYADSGLEPSGFSTNDWHTYDIRWDKGVAGAPGSFTWYVDGVAYGRRVGGWSTPAGAGADAPFDKPFYFLINMAVGGGYVGTPNLANGAYDFQLDYIRAYSATPEPASLSVLALGALAALRLKGGSNSNRRR